MIRCLSLAVLLALAGCAEKAQPAPSPPPPPPAPVEPEPARIKVQHVLIAFKNAKMAENVTRTQEEAKKLALDVLERAKKGEDFQALVKTYSTDPGGGTYKLANHGVKPGWGEMERSGFIKPFSDVAFKLKVGEVGLAEYEEKAAPYGWHVIKRLE